VPRGGPDGGDGGRGGDVVFRVDPKLNSLLHFAHKRVYAAENGGRGGPKDMRGKSAGPLFISVPPGTVVREATSGDLLGDLTEAGQTLVAARGGRGGRGNARFATPQNQAPRIGERGAPGEEYTLTLELKLIADVGIVGVPNAGKSTLLAAVTAARPKIAPYPFTTLQPNLGVAQLDVAGEKTLVLADIPGLIEGAHRGVGLGFDFLRHVQRTRVLIHLLDGLSTDPVADFSQINAEMALFDPNLAKKPQIVAVNKIDQPEVQELLPRLKKELKKHGVTGFMKVSALARTNVRELLLAAVERLAETPAIEEVEVPMPVYKPKDDPKEFSIRREDNGDWRVSGAAIERAAKMTYWEHSGSLRRFQKLMEALGVEEALRKAGVQDGDTVVIGDFELEWQD
jgi:GTP-binding protein